MLSYISSYKRRSCNMFRVFMKAFSLYIEMKIEKILVLKVLFLFQRKSSKP